GSAVMLWAQLNESCGEDPEFAREVIDEFLSTAPPMLERIERKRDEGDARGMAMSAHALKGSSRAIGAEALAAACAALEDAGKDGRTAEASVLSDRTAKEFERLRALLQAHLQEIAA